MLKSKGKGLRKVLGAISVSGLILSAAATAAPAGSADKIAPAVLVAASDSAVNSFYEERGFRLAWSVNGRPNSAAAALRDALIEAVSIGLIPEQYDTNEILREWPSSGQVEDAQRFDLLLTRAALRFVREAVLGRVDPTSVDPLWSIKHERFSPIPLLRRVLASEDPALILAKVGPTHAGYTALQTALARYRRIQAAGGWPQIPSGPGLRLSDHNDRVATLRQRLSIEDAQVQIASQFTTDPKQFDMALAEAVRRFQERHGLDPDAVVGARTLAALNIRVEERIMQIERSLERWRWLPRNLGSKYVLVNIPAALLQLLEEERVRLTSRVVVGRLSRPTPRTLADATEILINPTWTVPPTIWREDILPHLRRDPSWTSKRKMHVFVGWGDEAAEVNPHSVDWRNVSGVNSPYRVVQEAGDLNALGRIKIEMSNSKGVYLHDTPDKALFSSADRAKSSGCVRVQRILQLAAGLLGPRWSPQDLTELIAEGDTSSISLPRAIPVYFIYIPVVAEENGAVAFYPDIYSLDPALARALAGAPTAIAAAAIDACGTFAMQR